MRLLFCAFAAFGLAAVVGCEHHHHHYDDRCVTRVYEPAPEPIVVAPGYCRDDAYYNSYHHYYRHHRWQPD
jgi:hypothetical protein